MVGWAVAPLKVKATISLKGDRSDKSYTLNDATECSSKVSLIQGINHSVGLLNMITTVNVDWPAEANSFAKYLLNIFLILFY